MFVDVEVGDRTAVLKVGIIGTGYWADVCHAAAVEGLPGLELQGFWGRDKQKAHDLASRHRSQAFGSAKELFDSSDIVVLAVPPFVQSELALQAARSGCHLLLEKPPAVTSTEAWQIADACEENGVASVVNFSLLWGRGVGRWMDDVVLPKRWDAGSVTMLSDLRVSNGPFSASPWRLEANGALWDVGPHALALLVAALGPVTDVRAERGRGDTLVLTLHHTDEQLSTATLSYSLGTGSSLFNVNFWGPQGLTSASRDDIESHPTSAAVPALTALAEAIRSGKATRYDAKFGADIVEILVKADRAVTLR